MPLAAVTTFTEQRGDTLPYIFTVAGIDLTQVGTQAWFTGKTVKTAGDNSAIWQKTIGAGIVINSATTATVTLVPADTAGLSDGSIVYADFQAKSAAGVLGTPVRMEITVVADITQSTS